MHILVLPNLFAYTLGTIEMAKGQCAIASHLKVAYGSWTWSEEKPLLPWPATIKAPPCKEAIYDRLQTLLQLLSLFVTRLIRVWSLSSVLRSHRSKHT